MLKKNVCKTYETFGVFHKMIKNNQLTISEFKMKLFNVAENTIPTCKNISKCRQNAMRERYVGYVASPFCANISLRR